jgi:hypothetical protein
MPPLFFIGSSPSMAAHIISPDHPAAGVMVSVTQLSRRRSDFEVADWIMDSGAFTEAAWHGGYRRPVEWYFQEVLRWGKCGNLLAAVSQDWMCKGFVLGPTVAIRVPSEFAPWIIALARKWDKKNLEVLKTGATNRLETLDGKQDID